jgi:protein ImuB
VAVEKIQSALRIVAADRAALRLGLEPGLALADARARVPDLLVADMDRAADERLLEAIADWADRYTPLVGLDLPNGLLLDIAGCAHLFGGEAAIVADISTRLERLGLTTRIAIAGTAEAARAVSRYGQPGILPPGGEEGAVRPLPVAALGLDENLNIALNRAGLKTIGDLADRPRSPLAARFGAELLARLGRTLGEQDNRIVPRRPPPACLAERHFPEPIALEEHLLGTLGMLAANLARVLEERGEGGRRFEASFFRADGKVEHIAVDTGRPSRDPAVLMRLFRERIDALADPLDPGFGFDLVRLAIPVTEPLDARQSTLDGHEAADEEIAALTDRLTARFGAEHILGFEEMDSHIPERASRTVPLATQERVAAGFSRGARPAARKPGWNETAQQVEVEDEFPPSSPPPERGRACPGLDPGSGEAGVGVSADVAPLTPTRSAAPIDLPLTGGGKRGGEAAHPDEAPETGAPPESAEPPHPHPASPDGEPVIAASPRRGEAKGVARFEEASPSSGGRRILTPGWDGAAALDLFAGATEPEPVIGERDAVPSSKVIPFSQPKPDALRQLKPSAEESDTGSGLPWGPGPFASPEAEPPGRPLYLFDPPLPIETLAEVPEGPPLVFRWRRVQHQVARAEGPERIAPEWWRRGEDSLTRDYYRVEDQAGRRFWLFREGLYGRESNAPRWFIHGLFA